MRRTVLTLLPAALSQAAARQEALIQTAAKYVPGVTWQARSEVTGDFTCQGHAQTAIWGSDTSGIVVAVPFTGTTTHVGSMFGAIERTGRITGAISERCMATGTIGELCQVGILVTVMPTRNVNLTAELDSFVLPKVDSGRYKNASEVVRAALRTLEREEREYDLKLAALQTAIDAGDASGVAAGDSFQRVRRKLKLPAKKH